MSNIICCPVIIGFDDRISALSETYNPVYIATLRALYIEKNGTSVEDALGLDKPTSEFTNDDFEDILYELETLHEELNEEEAARMTYSLYNPSSILSQLKFAFTPQQIADRANLIADMFSDAINTLLASPKYSELTRRQLIMGCRTSSGEYIGGVGEIFREVDRQVKKYKRISENNAKNENGVGGTSQKEWAYRARQWGLIQKNLGALVVRANRIIKENEKINIAAKMHYAAPVETEDLEAAKLLFDFDVEEQARESYQEHKDNKNPIVLISTEVRRLLSSIKEFTTANEAYYDDLNFARKLRVSTAHQALMSLFRGVQNEGELIQRLESCNKETFPYAEAVLKRIIANPSLRTQLFIDFNRVAQYYAMISDKGGTHVVTLNEEHRTDANKKYLAKAKLQKLTENASSIFSFSRENKTTIVNKENVEKLFTFIEEHIKKVYNVKGKEVTREKYEKAKKEGSMLEQASASETNSLDELIRKMHSSRDERREALFDEIVEIYKNIFDALGIEVSPMSYFNIVNNSHIYTKLNEAILNLKDFGLYEISKATDFIEAISATKEANGVQVLKAFGENIGKIYGSINTLEENKMTNRAYFHGKSYFTDVMSSYLGKFRDRIKNALNLSTKNSNKVREVLLEMYGNNPILYDKNTGKFRVKWMQDLASNPTKNNSFSKIFNFSRLLGNVRQDFEDFGYRTQSVANMAGFFGGSDKMGWYPTFILGDSGVQKLLQAPKYSEEEIIDYFVEVALQDIDLYKELIALRDNLDSKFENLWVDNFIDLPVINFYEDIEDNGIKSKREKEKDEIKKELKSLFENDGKEKKSFKAFASKYKLDINDPKFIEKAYSIIDKTRSSFLGTFKTVTRERENIFALLPFLNKYENLVNIEGGNIKGELRKVIEAEMAKGFENYITNLRADGVFDINEQGNFKENLVNKIASKSFIIKNSKDYVSVIPENSFDLQGHLKDNLWNYYLNSRMAMVNQVQMMTISPAFYEDGLDGISVSFQKRYKQIHASGSTLSAEAQYPENHPNAGQRFCPSFSQRVRVFNDPRTDVRETNPEFYEALQLFDELSLYHRESSERLADRYTDNTFDPDWEEVKGKKDFSTPSTDGQSIRVLDSYMEVLGMSGRLNEDMIKIWNKINEIRRAIKENRTEFTEEEKVRYEELSKKFSEEPLTAEEHAEFSKLKEIKNGITMDQRKQLEDLQVALQPEKSFIYSLENVPLDGGGVMQIPIQIKHSECVVIPELLPKDSKLRAMIEWAEIKDVKTNRRNADLLCSDTCLKTANFGGVDIHRAKSADEVHSIMNGSYMHEISFDGYVRQQNNPEHIRQSRLIGTQSRKISFADLQTLDRDGNVIDYGNYLEYGAFDGGDPFFTLAEREYNGPEGTTLRQPARITHPNAFQINQLYVGIALANILEDFDKFANKISNPEKVRNILQQMSMNNDRANMEDILGLDEHIISENGETRTLHDFIVPLYEGGVEYDNVALLLSLFKNQVNKQKMMGGSAIQATAYGLNAMEESDNLKFRQDPRNKANILYAETEVPFDLSYTDQWGNEIPLEWSDWVETDGRPKLSDEIITKDDERYSKYMSYTDDHGVVHVPLIEQTFPGILDLIAVRIPTEAKYSMLPLKIVRFTSKVAGGGTIRLPLQGVTMAGFDFKQYWSH